MNKIQATVGILTLNSGKTLRRCLESVKEFAEVVICDGNSVDDTLDIAREYGCTIIKQYDTDEPNQRCTSDWSTVRNRNMDAATYDWYLYVDSDDELSPEVVAEVRDIVENKHVAFQIYRMPLHVFVDGKEVQYSSGYPAHQTRFFNRTIGARFIRPVHERVSFDTKHYQVGTLHNFYRVHISRERFERYSEYYARYARLEISHWEPLPTVYAYISWVFRWPIKGLVRTIILGTRNYIFHGFRHSMPVSMEVAKVRYYITQLVLSFKKQMTKNNREKSL